MKRRYYLLIASILLVMGCASDCPPVDEPMDCQPRDYMPAVTKGALAKILADIDSAAVVVECRESTGEWFIEYRTTQTAAPRYLVYTSVRP